MGIDEIKNGLISGAQTAFDAVIKAKREEYKEGNSTNGKQKINEDDSQEYQENNSKISMTEIQQEILILNSRLKNIEVRIENETDARTKLELTKQKAEIQKRLLELENEQAELAKEAKNSDYFDGDKGTTENKKETNKTSGLFATSSAIMVAQSQCKELQMRINKIDEKIKLVKATLGTDNFIAKAAISTLEKEKESYKEKIELIEKQIQAKKDKINQEIARSVESFTNA